LAVSKCINHRRQPHCVFFTVDTPIFGAGVDTAVGGKSL